jgi:ribonuclease P protein component
MPGARRDAALGREDRIRRHGEFDDVRRRGLCARGRLITIYEIANGTPKRRLGIAVPKSVGDAVTRNTVKRLIREAFRTGRGALAPGRDILVVARGAAAEATFAQIARELADLDAKLAPKDAALSAHPGAADGSKVLSSGRQQDQPPQAAPAPKGPKRGQHPHAVPSPKGRRNPGSSDGNKVLPSGRRNPGSRKG